MMTTIKEIAEASGFSQATVSRLLKGDTSLSVNPKTRQEIIQTAIQLGYPRSKIHTTLETIALLSWISEEEEFQDIYFHRLKEAIEKYGRINNMEVLTYGPAQGLQDLAPHISGFIALGHFSSKDIQYLKAKLPQGVFLEINPDPDSYDTVKPDTDRITLKAIQAFLAKGYRKIGFIGGHYLDPDSKQSQMDSREKVFRTYLNQLGLLQEAYVYAGGAFTIEQGYQLVMDHAEDLLSNPPQAIFVASDTIAIGALQAFNELQIAIPDQIELISINDNEVARFTAPPLTTYRIHVEEIAKTAIDLLVDQLAYPRQTTKTVLLNSELIIRKSFQP